MTGQDKRDLEKDRKIRGGQRKIERRRQTKSLACIHPSHHVSVVRAKQATSRRVRQTKCGKRKKKHIEQAEREVLWSAAVLSCADQSTKVRGEVSFI